MSNFNLKQTKRNIVATSHSLFNALAKKKKIGDEVRVFSVPVNLFEIAARITIKPLVERQFRGDS